ncbi:4-alpha-glucanotransferase [Christensenellaceae bacterium OttesenSCG-928-K19]|nr:4-alpha-glucanotransferase [Christensenellaceae bacterium OttesenSCG-928-K19]
MKRGNGILLHLTSLPSEYGTGSMGSSAYRFLEQLQEAGQGYWQVLPIYDLESNNPYQAVSAFAGNPGLIDIGLLLEEGLLAKKDISNADFAQDGQRAALQRELLSKACKNGLKQNQKEFTDFKYKHASWLFDYALFFVLRNHNGGKPFQDWDEDIRSRNPVEIMRVTEKYKEQIECVQFAQFLFWRQWAKLKEQAALMGVKLIGELPFYLSAGCVESWAEPELFDGQGGSPGRPPQKGKEHGRKWNYRLYNWEYLRLHGYQWWVKRLQYALQLFDIVRVDLLREADAFFAIPEGGVPADGHWEAGPGKELCDTLRYWLGDVNILAGDDEAVAPVYFNSVEYNGYACSRVLQRAFDVQNSANLPHRYERHAVCYTAAPGEYTTKGWFSRLGEEQKTNLKQYIGTCGAQSITEKLMRMAMGSVADVCILPMQDVLNLGIDASMYRGEGVPGNWKWRLEEGQFGAEKIIELNKMTAVYGRG